MEVIKGQSMFEDMYPCLAAVNRCAGGVTRHDGRVIWLTYEPVGPIEKTLMLVGKGITYDTGNFEVFPSNFTFKELKVECIIATIPGLDNMHTIHGEKTVIYFLKPSILITRFLD